MGFRVQQDGSPPRAWLGGVLYSRSVARVAGQGSARGGGPAVGRGMDAASAGMDAGRDAGRMPAAMPQDAEQARREEQRPGGGRADGQPSARRAFPGGSGGCPPEAAEPVNAYRVGPEKPPGLHLRCRRPYKTSSFSKPLFGMSEVWVRSQIVGIHRRSWCLGHPDGVEGTQQTRQP